MAARKRGSVDKLGELLRKADPADTVEYLRRQGSLSLWFASVTARKAREGDTQAAREILEDFVFAIDARREQDWPRLGPPIHWAYARYLADAFAKVLAGADARLALGVKSSKPGRRVGAKTTHDLEGLAAAFNLLLLRGFERKQAKLCLKEKTGANARTIEKADKQHVAYGCFLRDAQRPATSAEDRDFAAETMKVGAKRYAAEISAILAARKAR